MKLGHISIHHVTGDVESVPTEDNWVHEGQRITTWCVLPALWQVLKHCNQQQRIEYHTLTSQRKPVVFISFSIFRLLKTSCFLWVRLSTPPPNGTVSLPTFRLSSHKDIVSVHEVEWGRQHGVVIANGTVWISSRFNFGLRISVTMSWWSCIPSRSKKQVSVMNWVENLLWKLYVYKCLLFLFKWHTDIDMSWFVWMGILDQLCLPFRFLFIYKFLYQISYEVWVDFIWTAVLWSWYWNILLIKSLFNPLCAKFFRVNINIFTFYVIPPHWYDTST